VSDSHSSIPLGSRAILKAPGYRVVDGGTVWSSLGPHGVVAWHLKKPREKKGDGRLQIELRVNCKPWVPYVHIVVLEAFRGPRPAGLEGCHNDGNCLNNFVSNLRWDTHESNIADARKHGSFRGERNPRSKLVEADIPVIFRLSSEGRSQPEIGNLFGVCHVVIGNILRRKLWSHVDVRPWDCLPAPKRGRKRVRP
jgi:hypothetical protein